MPASRRIVCELVQLGIGGVAPSALYLSKANNKGQAMSDTFDHMLDAFESQDQDYQDQSYCNKAFNSHMRSSEKVFRELDKNEKDFRKLVSNTAKFYTKFTFDELEHSTPRAYLFFMEMDGYRYPISIWVPKSICRGMDEDSKTVSIHTDTFNSILAEHKEKCNG